MQVEIDPVCTSPLAVTIQEAVRISGLSRSELYRRLADGKVRAKKSGARTLILMESLRAHIDGLPAASFRINKAS